MAQTASRPSEQPTAKPRRSPRPRDNRPPTQPKGKLIGKTTPRLFTPPLRTLTRRTSHGYEVADFAEMIGEPLLPWERWVAIHALELLPDGTYRFKKLLIVVARQNGKSHLKRIVTLWRMYMNDRTKVLGVAQDVALAREQWNLCQDTIKDCPDLAAEFVKPRNVNGDEKFWLENGSLYAIKAANRRAGRGGTYDEVNIDELREQTDWAAYAAVSKTTRARPNPQLWMMSNAGDDNSVVLNQLRDAALSGNDPDIGIFEYSGWYEDGIYCELDDWEQIRQANPALGYLISAASIRSDMMTDPPEVFRAEVLCQRVTQIDAAVDAGAWKDCQDAGGSLAPAKKRIAVVFDISPDGKHATLTAAAVMPEGRVRVQVIAAWKSTDEARAELSELLDKLKPAGFGWFPTGPAAAFAPLLREQKNSVELTGNKVAEVCQNFADLVKARQILHSGEAVQDAHVIGASKLPSGDGWRFVRRGAGHCDAAYTAAGAVYVAQTMPAPKRGRIRVLG